MRDIDSKIEKLLANSDWLEMIDIINKYESDGVLEGYFKLKSLLLEIGVDKKLLNGIRKGLETSNWSEAIIAFSATIDDDICFYLGPMTPNERIDCKLGLILLARNPLGVNTYRLISENLDAIGGRLFGFPASFGGRYVELYDVLAIAGSMVRETRAIALFTPFYLEGWKHLDQNSLQRRTILFHNVVLDRFLISTYPLSKSKLKFNGEDFSLEDYTQDQIAKSIALWLMLHEMMHASGPLPLFGSQLRKLDMGKIYGSIEESRVDMSTWISLRNCEDIFQEVAGLTGHIIICERFFRSAKLGFIEGDPTVGAEGEHALFWLNLIIRETAGTFDSVGSINIDLNKLELSLQNFLQELYCNESEAASNHSNGYQILEDTSNELRKKFLSSEQGDFKMSQNWIKSTFDI